MKPTPEKSAPNAAQPDEEPTLLAAAQMPTPPLSAEQQKLWEAYCEQQRRRACPGCGEDGLAF